MKENFADRLNQALTARSMKAIELADCTGISRGQISKYVSGRVAPKQGKVIVMAKCLHVSPSWLLGLSEEMDESALQELIGVAQTLTDDQIRKVTAIIRKMRKEGSL